MTAQPLHRGIHDGDWPDGTYWLAEIQRPNGAPIFWADFKHVHGGWSYSTTFAAGFESERDLQAAWEERGDPERLAEEEGKLIFAEHRWG